MACGGGDFGTRTTCISWRSGQDEWTEHATLRSYKDISDILAFYINPISSHGKYLHAALVMQGDERIIIIGGGGVYRSSRLTGEIVKSKFAS